MKIKNVLHKNRLVLNYTNYSAYAGDDPREGVVQYLKKERKISGILRERLRTHKVYTEDQCFYLNYHKISVKSYVVDVY